MPCVARLPKKPQPAAALPGGWNDDIARCEGRMKTEHDGDQGGAGGVGFRRWTRAWMDDVRVKPWGVRRRPAGTRGYIDVTTDDVTNSKMMSDLESGSLRASRKSERRVRVLCMTACASSRAGKLAGGGDELPDGGDRRRPPLR